jgi:proline-specific peptidase
MAEIKDGYVPYRGFRTYYRIVGERRPGKLPLLALHGGPGCAHDYLESMDAIADQYGRQVIYYDQLGCGKSVTPSMPGFWNAKLWEEELDVIRSALGLDHIHILGQSWGGMLCLEYAVERKPKGIASMVIASSPASSELWVKEANRLCRYLPSEMQEALTKAAETGDYTTPEYKAAYDEYYRRHVCSIVPHPEFVDRSFDQMGEPYLEMQGASEFVITGKMKDFDYSGRLGEITIPTLVTSGTDDECTPLISKQIFDGIPDCRWELLPGTHLCHVEHPDLYNRTVETFLAEHDHR